MDAKKAKIQDDYKVSKEEFDKLLPSMDGVGNDGNGRFGWLVHETERLQISLFVMEKTDAKD